MKHDELDQKLRETFSGAAPAALHEQMERHFEALAAEVRRPRAAPDRRASVLSRWLWPGMSLAGAAAAIVLLCTLLFSSTVSWAQVVERFRSLRYFGVTVYVADDPAQPPEKLEIWATQDHRSRVHCRGLIFFGKGEEAVKVVRAATGTEVPLDELKGQGSESGEIVRMAMQMQASLGKMPNFSLDELLGFFSGKRQDLRPVPNVDVSLATDLQVFDLTSKVSPEWLRLWVLKKSELPARIRSFDPRRGAVVEAVFDYFTQMPDDAFDPAKVALSIRSKQGGANKLYALLKDPGGRPLTPEDLFAQSGLHLPAVAAAGRTAEGILWVQSHEAVHHRVDGSSFDGWGGLTDNLGQEYLRVEVGQRLEGDLQEEYYIPLSYHAGYRAPASYTLTCQDWDNGVRHSWRDQTRVLGSAKLVTWQENAPVPKLFDRQEMPTSDDAVRRVLHELAEIEDWPRFDTLAATIGGTPEASPLALYREMLRAKKLDLIRQHDEAAALRARLFPLLWEKLKQGTWEEWELIEAHVSDLVQAGKADEARPLANRFIAEVPVQREIHIANLILRLHRLGMKEPALRKFFDEDVFSLPQVKEDLDRGQFFQANDWDPASGPRLAVWRAYLTKLSARYEHEPLPATWEFIEEMPVFPQDQACPTLPLPGHPEYRVFYDQATPLNSLKIATAQAFGLADSSLVTLVPELKSALKPMVCVYKSETNGAALWEAYLKQNKVEAVWKSAPRSVLVARYDGRKLPNCFRVPPLDCSALGTPLVYGSNSASGNNPTETLYGFAMAMNSGIAEGDPRRVIILNETGLPDQPAPSQSAANVGLVYDMAFWASPEANKMAFAWFRDNFGITFREEERAMPMVELHPH